MARILGSDDDLESFDSDCTCKKYHDHDSCHDHAQEHSDHHGHHDHHDHDHCHHHGRKCHCQVRIGRVTVDCTPVTFRTCGQAFNLVTCPFTQVTSQVVEQTISVPMATQCVATVPVLTSCMTSVPITQLTQVPVISTLNVPPEISPMTVSPFFTGQNIMM